MQEKLEHSHQTKGLIRLTMACNERCSFCNVPVENYQRPTPPWEQIEQELDAFVETGQQTLTISGGEPTLLRRRLLRLIRQAKDKGISFVELQTNAVLLTEEYVAELVDAGLTSAFVSLLSDQEDLHDELVELEGAFQSCTSGIRNLLCAGIWVTLNPVLTSKTATRILDYIDFVHEHFPQIQTISLSAVQPHGRAEENWALLPDYQELKELVPIAIERAKQYGIELLNPYCGLPICIGWTTSKEKCVETVDYNKKFRPNIQNHGNKSKREACHWCAYRVGCGGAWHRYWEFRGGSGIQAPYEIVPPWITVVQNEYQSVFFEPKIEELQPVTPTTWIVLHSLERERLKDLFHVSYTELVLSLDWKSPVEMKETVRLLKILNRRFQQTEQRLHVLVDSRRCSIANQKMWSQICHHLSINCKIAEELPTDFFARGKND